jgi:hypothetical protein
MPRKPNTDAHQQEEDRPGKARRVSITLSIGNWKNIINEYQVKLFIAWSLNYCVDSQQLRIRGYLITNDRLYMVWFIQPDLVNRMLMIFYEKLRREIHRFLEKQRQSGICLTHEAEMIASDESFEDLFEKYPFHNHYLMQLICGEKIELPYYDPNLEKAKRDIQGAEFCSAIDYSGAIGPVNISFKDHAN